MLSVNVAVLVSGGGTNLRLSLTHRSAASSAGVK